MTVDELIKQLKKFPADMEVISSVDPEGNGYNRIFHIFDALIEPTRRSYIDAIYLDEDIEQGEYDYSDDEPFDSAYLERVAVIS